MIKIDINNSTNLTLLYGAYFDNLFPKSIYGELLYEEDLSNIELTVRYLYFEEVYYVSLMEFLKSDELMIKISESNSRNEWLNLIETLKNYTIVENVDVGVLNIYTPSKINFNTISLSNSIVESVLNREIENFSIGRKLFEEIQKDLRRIYQRVDISINNYPNGMGISILIPIKEENEQRFPFKPIIELLKKYNQEIEDLNFYKGAKENNIHVSMKIKDWKHWTQR